MPIILEPGPDPSEDSRKNDDDFLAKMVDYMCSKLDQSANSTCPLTVSTDWGNGYVSHIIYNICMCATEEEHNAKDSHTK